MFLINKLWFCDTLICERQGNLKFARTQSAAAVYFLHISKAIVQEVKNSQIWQADFCLWFALHGAFMAKAVSL